MIAFVVYAIIASQNKGSDINRAVERTSQNIDKQLGTITDLKDKVIPSMIADVRINEVKLGEGSPAVCGQTATIAYDSWLSQDKPYDDKATQANPLTFTIGAGKVLPAFERGIIGMQKGGKRVVFASPAMAYEAEGFKRDDVPANTTVKFEIELLSVKPDMPGVDATSFRIIDTLPNTGNIIFCGAKARFHVVIWSVSGKKLYSTYDTKSPIEFTPGASEVFLGLEQGVIGMVPKSQRMLIVPPAFQKTMTGANPTLSFPLPKAETVLVDVEALP